MGMTKLLSRSVDVLVRDAVLSYDVPHGWSMNTANDFFKSIKFMCSDLWCSAHCSLMFRNVRICSVQDLLFLKPPCSFLNCLSTSTFNRFRMTVFRTFSGIDTGPGHRIEILFDQFLRWCMDNMEVSCHLSNGPSRIAFGVLLYLSGDIFHLLWPWKTRSRLSWDCSSTF